MESSELEKCESSVQHGGRDEISKRRVEAAIRRVGVDKPANKAEGLAQRRAKGDHLGPEERMSCLPFHIETNTKGITTFLSVVKLDKRKWLRRVFSS